MTNIICSMNDTLGLCEEKKNSGVAFSTIFMQTRFKEVLDIPPVSPDGDVIGKQTGNVTESPRAKRRQVGNKYRVDWWVRHYKAKVFAPGRHRGGLTWFRLDADVESICRMSNRPECWESTSTTIRPLQQSVTCVNEAFVMWLQNSMQMNHTVILFWVVKYTVLSLSECWAFQANSSRCVTIQ